MMPPRRLWNILDKALRSYGMVSTRADRCCYVLYSVNSREQALKQNNSAQWHDTSNILTNARVRTARSYTTHVLLQALPG